MPFVLTAFALWDESSAATVAVAIVFGVSWLAIGTRLLRETSIRTAGATASTSREDPGGAERPGIGSGNNRRSADACARPWQTDIAAEACRRRRDAAVPREPRERPICWDGALGGRYWARTSDLQLVELALSQLS